MPSSPAPAALRPRERRPGGCGSPVVVSDLEPAAAADLAAVVKALADPTRLRIVDALRLAAPEAICQCELLPLFDLTQQGLARHLKVLVAAGVVGSERRGLWTHYVLRPEALEPLRSWLA